MKITNRWLAAAGLVELIWTVYGLWIALGRHDARANLSVLGVAIAALAAGFVVLVVYGLVQGQAWAGVVQVLICVGTIIALQRNKTPGSDRVVGTLAAAVVLVLIGCSRLTPQRDRVE